MFASLLLLALAGPPSTHVEVEAGEDVEQHEAIEARLVGRLLDAGLALAPTAEQADVRVVVTVGDTGATVVVSRDSVARVHIVRQEIEQVRYLEVAHRAIETVDELVEADAVSDHEAPSVGLVLDPSVPDRGRIASAVLAAGLGVVPADALADSYICVRKVETGYEVLRSRSGSCTPPVVHRTLASTDQLVPAVGAEARTPAWFSAATGTTLAREADEAFGATPVLLERAPPPPPPNPMLLRTHAALGVQGGRQFAEPTVAAALSIGRWTGPVGELRGKIAPSSGADFRALDSFVSAGMLARFAYGERIHAAFGITGGVLIHRFDHEDEATVVRVDPQATVPVRLSITTRSGFGLDLVLTQTYSIRDRRYIRDGNELWSRPAYRIGGAVGCHFDRVFR